MLLVLGLIPLVGAVVGEYLGSAAGLGYLIHQAEGVFDVTGVFAGMFVLMAFVLIVDSLVTLVERRLLVDQDEVGHRRARDVLHPAEQPLSRLPLATLGYASPTGEKLFAHLTKHPLGNSTTPSPRKGTQHNAISFRRGTNRYADETSRSG